MRRANAPAALGLDVGGHGVKAVVVDGSGRVLHEDRDHRADLSGRGVDAVLERIAELVARLDRAVGDRRALPVGVGLPGFLDRKAALLRASPNFPDWIDVPVEALLEARLDRTVVVENDANCAVLGEAWTGAAAGLDDVVMLTLGTGVGSGLLVGGRVVGGARGAAGEGGHVAIHERDPRPCGCGLRGCLETYCSGPGLVRTAEEEADARGEAERPADASEVFARVPRSPACAAAVARFAEDLARGLAPMVHLLSPQAIVLGGGVAAAFASFEAPLRSALEARTIPACRAGLLLRAATLGGAAGAVGAARLVVR